MIRRKLEIQMNGRSDEFGTPVAAAEILAPFLDKSWKILECAWGGGVLAAHLRRFGFTVVGDKGFNFLTDKEGYAEVDCIVTNPPYSLKEEFLGECYRREKPFALLMPLTALEGKARGKMYSERGIQVLIPNKRFNFITPSGKGSGAWFQTAWFCWRLNLPRDLMFIKVEPPAAQRRA